MSLGGESGRAVLADDRSGTRRVAKTWPGGPAELARLRGRLALVDRLRVGGWPIPAVHSTNCVNGEVSIAWEWVDGEISNRPAPAMVADLLALATRPRPATADPGGTFADWLLGSLREGCDGYCLHDPLRRHGRMARALLHRVRRIGEQTPAGAIPTGGIVHRDLHHRNVLWRDGRIAAVVDWEGRRSGRRRLRPGHAGVRARTERRCRRGSPGGLGGGAALAAGPGAAGVLRAHGSAPGRLVDPPPPRRRRSVVGHLPKCARPDRPARARPILTVESGS